MTAVSLQSVSFTVGGATLVDNVDLAFDGGAAVAIVGPNGAGKSTLMRLLSGDLKPTSGHVLIAGKDVHAYRPRELAQRRAILSQHISVTFPFSVEEIVRMGAPDERRIVIDPLVDTAFEEAELSPFRSREFPTLSGGEQQRAHFARTLLQLTIGEKAHGKGLLLLDEPTSNLDLRHQIKLLDAARARADAGACVIAVLHDLNLAARFATRIVVMHGGCVIGDGRPADVITSELMRRAFGVSVKIGQTERRSPYILQQDMQAV